MLELDEFILIILQGVIISRIQEGSVKSPLIEKVPFLLSVWRIYYSHRLKGSDFPRVQGS